MPRYAQLVIGPAGSGKSTYCYNVQQHCASLRRTVHVINLDPAAENFNYEVAANIQDLISLSDVMEELELGPNGGLIYCMEYLEDNMDEWLREELEGYGDDDYILFDCPGQIELYSHVQVFRTFVDQLKQWDFNVCAVYLTDSQFITDSAKFIAGTMCALAAMVRLELPHVNVLTKVDLLPDKRVVDKYLYPEARELLEDLNEGFPEKFKRLNEAMAQLVDDYSMVSYLPLDVRDEDSIQFVLQHIDNAIQFGEDADVRIARDVEENDEDGGYEDE